MWFRSDVETRAHATFRLCMQNILCMGNPTQSHSNGKMWSILVYTTLYSNIFVVYSSQIRSSTVVYAFTRIGSVYIWARARCRLSTSRLIHQRKIKAITTESNLPPSQKSNNNNIMISHMSSRIALLYSFTTTTTTAAAAAANNLARAFESLELDYDLIQCDKTLWCDGISFSFRCASVNWKALSLARRRKQILRGRGREWRYFWTK